MVTEVLLGTALVVTVNVAVVAPAVTVTLGDTCAAFVLLLVLELVLAAGQQCSGSACSRRAFSFFGPQLGRWRRSATIAASTASGMAAP